jgi:anti-anti-sigma factor
MASEMQTPDGTAIIALPRRLDADSAPRFSDEIRPVLKARTPRVLFDLAPTDYISSAGVRSLLAATRSISEYGGRAVLASPGRQVMYVFELTGFTRIFTICSTRTEAMEELAKVR